jgi:hypothetical protein
MKLYVIFYILMIFTLICQFSKARQVSEQLVPPHARKSPPISYLHPLTEAYSKKSYDSLRTAIFPGYFHGKCQVDGVNPKGCPNPDCPVVCGTPGSLVHFYGKLRQIAFNETREMLRELSKPEGSVFKQILKGVKADEKRKARKPRMIRVYGRIPGDGTPDATSKQAAPGSVRKYRLKQRDDDNQTDDSSAILKKILDQIPRRLEEECGGTGKDGLDGLGRCSWEEPMKEFILSYP